MIEPALTGRLDRDDRLVAGDPGFVALNARAGGAIGIPLATPPLATVVRLARKLGIPVSRALTIADGDADLDCRARACPEGSGVTLTLADLHERPPAPRLARPTDPAPRFPSAAASRAAEPLLAAAFDGRLERALRGPLARIIASADSMAGDAGALDPPYADYAADIASAGRHLLGLVDDLADLQAIERDDFHVADDAIDLADVARRAAGLLAVRAADAGIAIDRPAPDVAVPATGEFRRTLQVLVNLIANAVAFAPRGGTIWIHVQREADRAVAIVADGGPGIAVADQARIFEKFERIDTREPAGSGLGLYIARRLARAMGGDLTVDSAPGEGARFILSIPAR